MKPILLLPPGLAILATGVWLGLQHQSLSNVETQNTTLRQRIEAARLAGPGDDDQKTAGAGKNGKQGAKKINWKELALKQKDMNRGDSIPDMRAMMELQRTLFGLSTEELAAHLDEISALEIPDDAKAGLQGIIIGILAERDPKLVMERFGDQLGDDRSSLSWQISHAFQQWAQKDSASALAWLDGQIAAGKLESKSLNGTNDLRQRLEGAVITSLLSSDPAAAAERLSRIPEGQRAAIFQAGLFFSMKPGSEKAAADLIRSHVPEEQRTSTIASSASMLIHQGGYERVTKFMNDIGASPAERAAIVGQSMQGKIGQDRDKAKFEGAVEEARTWAIQQAPEAADRLTGEALGRGYYDFAQSSALVLKYQEQTGSDEVLIAFLEQGGTYNQNPKGALELVEKISDPAKREELRKKLSQAQAPPTGFGVPPQNATEVLGEEE
jgi:hypothetical protein